MNQKPMQPTPATNIELITAITPMYALLSALVLTHPDRDALWTTYDSAAARLFEGSRSLLPANALADLKAGFDGLRMMISPPNTSAAN